MAADYYFSLPALPFTANEALPTEAHLRETLALAGESWALDFLFNLDASADVGVLTSPSQLQHGTVVDINESIFETAGEYSGLFNMDIFCRWLMVPCFTANDISAEVIVQSEEKISNESFCRCRGNTTTVRMLRSNTTGEMLFSIENPNADEISLTSFRIDTKASRKRIFIRGKRDVFLQAVLDPKGIDYRKMAQSLQVSDVTREFGRCAECAAAAPGLGCFCRVEFKRPKHPLDFATSRTNMECHAGRFSGSVNFNLLEKGVANTSAMLASTINVEAREELGLVELLADMGIKNRMLAGAVVPRSVAKPSVDGDVGLSFVQPGTVTSVHFDSAIRSFDGFGAFGEPFGSILGSSSSGRDVESSLTVPDSGVLRIEPVPTRSDVLVPTDDSVQEKEIADRELKRKMRNREAAARSNARRKQRNDARKANLAAIRKRKCELERRESELKQENARLLKLVNS